MAQSRGVPPAASTDLLCPLIFRVAICFFPCRCMKPFTTASHFVGGWSPTGSAPVGAQHDRLAVERQSKLELVEENNFSNCIVVRCGNEAGANPLCGMRAFTHLWNCLAPKPGSHRQRDRATIKVDSEQRGRGMPNIDRDGVKIHYEVHGDGPPLILTHGYSSTSAMWNGQIEALSRHHKL